MFYHFFELMEDVQVELKEEAESQTPTKLNLPTRSGRREGQLFQEDVVRLIQGLLIPRPDGEPHKEESTKDRAVKDDIKPR